MALDPRLALLRIRATALPRQPWQMTFQEFVQSMPIKRREDHPDLTFEAWIRQERIDPRSFATEFEVADYIGGTLLARPNRSRHEMGKYKGLVEKYHRRKELEQRYQQEVTRTTIEWDIDLERAADRALARAMYRREIQKALRQGLPVPPEILAEVSALRSARPEILP